MLKTRLLTGFLAAFVVLAGLVNLDTIGVAIGLGAVVALAAFEWSSLCGRGTWASLFFACLVVVLGLASLRAPLTNVMIVALAGWLWATCEVFLFRGQPSRLWRHKDARLFWGIFILVPAWRGCVALKAQAPGHPWVLVWLLMMVWTADSLAYFAGRTYGRHKLAPLVSPGKTWEGAAGGLLGAALVGAVGAFGLSLGTDKIMEAISLGAIVAAFSVIGDLLESKAKRLAGVKDSGRGLPGHGGIFDRIDALTAAVPIFVLGVEWLGVVR